MARFSTTRHVDAPPQRVFEVFTDLRHMAEIVRGIVRLEVLTEGPTGVGTRFRETRMMFKREGTEEMEISAFDPPRGFAVGCESCGCAYLSSFRFEPDGEGTRVTVDFEARPVTFLAKLMSPLGKVMMASCKKAFDGDLEDLSAVAEGCTVAVPV